MSAVSVLLLNGGAHKLVQGAAPKQRQVLSKHRTEPLTEQHHLLLLGVDVVGAILWEVVKPLAVLVDTPRTLLQVQELLKLVSHQAPGYVVSMKGLAELSPRHLVAILKISEVACPPSTGGPMKLLGHIQTLLELGIVQEPKLGLGDMKPVLRLKWIRRFGEHRRVHL
jgi:hypothetical protein